MSREIICGIYKITSPSGKIYIGQSKDVHKRFRDYFSLRCKCQNKLYHSFKKYGVENHKFEIIEKCYKSNLDKFEEHYIKFYNSCDISLGLNIRSGGHFTKMNEDLKNKLSIIKKRLFRENKELYNSTVKRLNLINRTGKNNHNYGIGKSFLKFDKELNLLSEYKSLCDLKVENNIQNIYIYRCCKRQRRYVTAGGFIWRFKDDCIVIDGKLQEEINLKKI